MNYKFKIIILWEFKYAYSNLLAGYDCNIIIHFILSILFSLLHLLILILLTACGQYALNQVFP